MTDNISPDDASDNPAMWVVPTREECTQIDRAAERFWQKRNTCPPSGNDFLFVRDPKKPKFRERKPKK